MGSQGIRRPSGSQGGQGDQGIPVDINLVIDRLLSVISGQVLTIANLEALNAGLMQEIDALRGQVEKG